MVLVSLLLVLAAAVALVIGLLQSGLAIIYVSIGCSVVAGILLAVAVVRGKPEKASTGPMERPAPGATPPPAPPSPSWESPQAAPAGREREPVTVGAGASARPDETQQLDQAAIELAVRGDDDDLPIANYDRLRATEVLPLLADLDSEQLAVVRDHEASGRNRFMVLSRIDRELEARGLVEETAPAEAPSHLDEDDDWESDDAAATVDDESTEQGEEEPDERPSVAPAFATSGASGSILDNYEQLKVLEILPRLGGLNADELTQVRRREQAGQRRAMIINRVDRLLVDNRPEPVARPARAARPASPAPARRGSAKKSAVKEAPTRKAAAKTAAPAKVATKKTAAKRLAAKKTPTKKVAAKKVATKKTAKATKKR